MTCILDFNTALEVVIQPTFDTFVAPTSADRLSIANVSFDKTGVTVANPEYTGSVMRNPDEIIGKTVSLAFDVLLRPPGGATPPAANAFLPGRILQSAKFTEVIVATAISEALGVGSTVRAAVLGATALATIDLYKGMVISLGATGTYRQKLTPIRSYAAGKTANLCRALGSAPTGTYSIPAQLMYSLSIDNTDPPLLSFYFWRAGKRWSLKNAVVTGFTQNLPTTSKTGGEIPSFRVTYDVTIEAYIDQAAPQVTAGGTVPVFRDGEHYVSEYPIGGQSVTIDLGIASESEPNPNRATGSDRECLTALQPVLSYDWSATLIAELDKLGLAEAHADHAWFAQYGYTAGNVVVLNTPDMRYDIPNDGTNGSLMTETGRMVTPVKARPFNYVFPY